MAGEIGEGKSDLTGDGWGFDKKSNKYMLLLEQIQSKMSCCNTATTCIDIFLLESFDFRLLFALPSQLCTGMRIFRQQKKA